MHYRDTELQYIETHPNKKKFWHHMSSEMTLLSGISWDNWIQYFETNNIGSDLFSGLLQ